MDNGFAEAAAIGDGFAKSAAKRDGSLGAADVGDGFGKAQEPVSRPLKSPRAATGHGGHGQEEVFREHIKPQDTKTRKEHQRSRQTKRKIIQ